MRSPVPLPIGADEDSLPFWEGLSRGEVLIQRCTRCRTLRWPARAICNRCFSFEHDWHPVSGRARLSSWVRTFHVFVPAFADKVPYITVRAALAEQDNILIIGTLLHGSDDPDPMIGMAIEAIIECGEGDVPRLCWRQAGL